MYAGIYILAFLPPPLQGGEILKKKKTGKNLESRRGEKEKGRKKGNKREEKKW